MHTLKQRYHVGKKVAIGISSEEEKSNLAEEKCIMNPASLVAPAGCGGRLGGGDSLLLDRDGVGGILRRCHGSRISPSDENEVGLTLIN